MARVLVLGGAGDMGSGIVEELASMPGGPDEVVIGDVRREAALRVIEGLGEARGEVGFVEVDARDRAGLVRVMRGFDAVVSALGPFYEWGFRVAEAAVEAGVGLVDICDDYDAAEAILGLSPRAEAEGVLILTGLGWTPGITNVLARLGSEELDEVDSIKIYWSGSAADSRGLAVVMHVFHAVTGRVPMHMEGGRRLVEAGTGGEEVVFPPPIGPARVVYTGHPEPVTIPRYIPARNVVVKGGLVPSWQNTLARVFVKLGLTKTPARKRRLAKIIHKIEDVFRAGGVEASSARVDLEGSKAGEPRTITYAVVDRMRRLTAVPASIGAAMMVRGEIGQVGAYPPEAILDPHIFTQRLAERGIEILQLQDNEWRPLQPPTSKSVE